MMKKLIAFFSICLCLSMASPAWAAWTRLNQDQAQEKVSDTSISLDSASVFEAGNILVVSCGTDNPDGTNGQTTHHTVSDSDGGNTWTKIREQQRSGGAAADGATISLWASDLLSEISGTETITCTIDSAVTAKTLGISEYSVAAGKTYSTAGHNGATGTTSAFSVTLSGLASVEHLFLGSYAYEGVKANECDDADFTLRADIATTGGGAASNITLRLEDRILTATTDTFNCTLGANLDWAGILAAIDEVDEGAPPACPLTLTTLGVGC